MHLIDRVVIKTRDNKHTHSLNTLAFAFWLRCVTFNMTQTNRRFGFLFVLIFICLSIIGWSSTERREKMQSFFVSVCVCLCVKVKSFSANRHYTETCIQRLYNYITASISIVTFTLSIKVLFVDCCETIKTVY